MELSLSLIVGALAVLAVVLVIVIVRPTLGFLLLATIHVVKGGLRMRFPALMEGFTYDMALVGLVLPAAIIYRFRKTGGFSLRLPTLFVASWILFAILMWVRLPGSHSVDYGWKKCLIFSIFTTLACLSCVIYVVSTVEIQRLAIVFVAAGAVAMLAVTFLGQATESYRGARFSVEGTGPLGLANLGGQMVIMLFAMWILRPRLPLLLIAAALTALGVYGIFLTGTRGPLFAIAAAVPLLLWFARRRLSLGVTVGVALVGLAIAAVPMYAVTQDMLFRFTHRRLSEGLAVRFDMTFKAIDGFLGSPLIGTGTGDTAYQLFGYGAEGYPHNHVVEVANELGIFGLALYLIMFGYGFRVATWLGKKPWEKTDFKRIGLPLFLGFLFYVAISFKMGTYAVNYMGFIFLVLLVQLDQLRRDQVQLWRQSQVAVPGQLPPQAHAPGALAPR